MELIVKKSKWHRGSGFSHLLNADDSMCILGFYGKTLGVTNQDLRYYASPDNAINKLWPLWLWGHDFVPLSENDGTRNNRTELSNINDSRLFSDEERETKIVEMFSKFDVQVKFVD